MAFDLVARLRVKDEASAALRRATQSAEKYRDSLSKVNGSNDKLARSSESLGRAIGGSLVSGFGKLAIAAAGAAAAYQAVSVAADSVKKAMDFEAQMSTIEALTGASADEMARMQALALKMGAQTKYSALEAAQGIEELLKAGLTPASVEAGGLEAALNLATAGGLELADAAEIMSTALNAFRDDGMSAAQASDILAGTANASATSVEEMRYSLSAVSSVAAGVGLSFKDTNIALGLFANNGLKGSDAGTSLKTMLQNLQPTTKDQIALFRKLGLTAADGSNAFYDAAGNIKSIEDISGILRNSLSKLTNQQRSLALETLFGSDAIRAGNILYKEGAEGVRSFEREMSKVTALDVARKKMDNAAGAVEQFKGALETLQITALLPTLPAIKDLANAAADVVESWNTAEFQDLSLSAKVGFIFDDLSQRFLDWYNAGGKAKIEQTVNQLATRLSEAVAFATPILIDIGAKMGLAILDGLSAAFKNGIKNLLVDIPVTDDLLNFYDKLSILPKNGPESERPKPSVGDFFLRKDMWKNPFGGSGNSHAGGLDRVPYNGYPAILHHNEAILPAGEARQYRNDGGNAAGATVQINGPINIHTEADYQTFVQRLVRDIQNAGNAGAGSVGYR